MDTKVVVAVVLHLETYLPCMFIQEYVYVDILLKTITFLETVDAETVVKKRFRGLNLVRGDYPHHLLGITAGLFMTISVLAMVNSPFFSAVIISATDFNIFGVALAFHFTKFS